LLPLLIAFLLPQALLLVWLGLWLLVILITVFSLRNKVFFSRIFPDFQTGSASLAPPAGERGVASNRSFRLLDWDPNPSTGSKLGRLLASTSKCLAQSNKSPERGTATKRSGTSNVPQAAGVFSQWTRLVTIQPKI
jgi:hypothetical protein